jgi:spore coat polysaccharide biosynthesis predicted glycosyltransferase SpsG
MGHLFRMLSFSDLLREKGIPFRFLANPDTVAEAILARRHCTYEQVDLQAKNDWQSDFIRRLGVSLWIDDRLNTDRQHAARIKACGIPRVTFDDRGTGAAPADLHVAALAFDDTEALGGMKVLRGPRYLVLNREIERFRRPRTGAGSILVTMGGSDTHGATVRVVQMLKAAGRSATVVIGPAFKHEAELQAVLTELFIIKRDLPSLIEEFNCHSLAITGGGITPFEANASGLPCVVIANEDFEIPVARGLADMGGAVFAGHCNAIDESLLTCELPIAQMSEAAMARVDLQGAERVLDEIGRLL